MGGKSKLKPGCPFNERYIVATNGCWEWQGGLTLDGYGQTTVNGRTRRAHRVAYEMANGPIPAGKIVLHTCDNPKCCNPDHLLLGTQADNIADMMAKGRHNPTSGTRNPAAKLTMEQVRTIRARYARGGTTAKVLAADFGVTLTAIYRIIHGRGYPEEA